ncbi:MAG: hypothetical protein AB7G93_02045 [Bdellovibrionales bacterium]
MSQTLRSLVLLSAAGFLFSACNRFSRPVTLTPEVQKFIETTAGGSSCAQVPKLMEHVARLERTVAELSQLKTGKKRIADARKELTDARRSQMESLEGKLRAIRKVEAEKLKRSILLTCADLDETRSQKKGPGGPSSRSPRD